jgi:hypothetical protein
VDEEDEAVPLLLEVALGPIPSSDAITRRLAGLIGYPGCPCACPSIADDEDDDEVDSIIRGLRGDDGLQCLEVAADVEDVEEEAAAAAEERSGSGARKSESGSSDSGWRVEEVDGGLRIVLVGDRMASMARLKGSLVVWVGLTIVRSTIPRKRRVVSRPKAKKRQERAVRHQDVRVTSQHTGCSEPTGRGRCRW